MLETLELDRAVEVGIDPLVRDAVVVALHVGLEGIAVSPAADHHELAVVAVRLPHLQIDEAVGLLDEPGAAPEGRHELRRALVGHPKP